MLDGKVIEEEKVVEVGSGKQLLAALPSFENPLGLGVVVCFSCPGLATKRAAESFVPKILTFGGGISRYVELAEARAFFTYAIFHTAAEESESEFHAAGTTSGFCRTGSQSRLANMENHSSGCPAEHTVLKGQPPKLVQVSPRL